MIKQFGSWLSFALLLTVVSPWAGLAQTASTSKETALDRYVQAPDPSYTWEIVSTESGSGMTTVVVDMVSQTWRTPEEVDRTRWQHWMTLAIPDRVRSEVGFLFIGGGRNGGDPPSGPSDLVRQIAAATGTVVAELRMVPNQPLVFHGDGQSRSEDDLIGYTWDQFLKTGDPTWPARNPMVKSAVRAMDTMTAVAASEVGGGRTVDRFVVAGASKRGWTTWLTGAVDDRVVALIPIVIDVLNVNEAMRHHFAAYGFWAPSVGDYVHHRITERFGDPRLEALYDLVDPYAYCQRLDMPKLILNAAGDQFFLPDSSQFYWDDLIGEKHLRYVPNADHGLNETDAFQSIVAFHGLIVDGRERPRFTWTNREDGAIVVRAEDQPLEVRLWSATNPQARDFRVETLGRAYTSRLLEPEADGSYVGLAPTPRAGWIASFVELTFDVGLDVPLKLTTGVRVQPERLPFADKDPGLRATLTVRCTATDAGSARQILDDVGAFVRQNGFAADDLRTQRVGTTCYVNWTPTESFRTEGRRLAGWLQEQGANDIRYRLESGPGPSTDPAPTATRGALDSGS